MRRGQLVIGAVIAVVVVVAIAAVIYFTQQPSTADITVTHTDAASASNTPGTNSASTAATPSSGGSSSSASTLNADDIAQTSTGATSGPGIVKTQHGDWQLSCDTPPGASFEQCAIIQNVTAEDQPNVGLSVIVLKTADNKARLLRVLAPLGVLLPNGLGLNVDGSDMGRVAFVRCLPNGCVAEVVMDDALVSTLSNGKSAIFIVFKTPEEGIGIPVSLNGFKEGFAALP